MNDVISYYNSNAKDYSDRTLKLDMHSFYPFFLKKLKEKSKVLDAGCGSGRDAKVFQELGLEVSALDASEELCKLASQLILKPVYHMQYNEMQFEQEFEAIWAAAALIHIPEEELVYTFKRFVSALKVGGIWFFSFKYGTGTNLRNGINYYQHNEESIKEVLKNFKELRLLKMWSAWATDSFFQPQEWFCTLVRKLW